MMKIKSHKTAVFSNLGNVYNIMTDKVYTAKTVCRTAKMTVLSF